MSLSQVILNFLGSARTSWFCTNLVLAHQNFVSSTFNLLFFWNFSLSVLGLISLVSSHQILIFYSMCIGELGETPISINSFMRWKVSLVALALYWVVNRCQLAEMWGGVFKKFSLKRFNFCNPALINSENCIVNVTDQ